MSANVIAFRYVLFLHVSWPYPIRGDMQKFIAIVTEMTSNERDGAIEVEPTGDTL